MFFGFSYDEVFKSCVLILILCGIGMGIADLASEVEMRF
jgi:hypothetical protein